MPDFFSSYKDKDLIHGIEKYERMREAAGKVELGLQQEHDFYHYICLML